MGLPWREGHLDVPNHFHICLNNLRLHHQKLLEEAIAPGIYKKWSGWK